MHPSIVPRPRELKISEGEFELQATSRIIASPGLQREAGYLAGMLRKATGFPLDITFGDETKRAGDLVLECAGESGSPEPEAYELSVLAGSPLLLKAAMPVGIQRGIQTMLQLLPPAIFGSGPRIGIAWKMPCVEIVDSPRFAWRGAMLDCARHFMPKEFIKKFIDLLALHKLNVFHWHLTDDQGWRLEVKKYPRLTGIGAWRRETVRGHLNAEAGGDGIPHGGFYTQKDAREIVAYAEERHITIVPEIEMPGHMQAAIAAYPELGCVEEPIEVWTRWGINPNICNVSESSIAFLQDVLEEVIGIFPGKFIHVGGDEAVKTQWDGNEKMMTRMREAGVKDSHALQSWFIGRMSEFLARHGRRLVGWDEILEGGLAPGATAMSWRGMEGGIAAARLGHDAVMAPCPYTYFDAYYSEEISSEPLAIGNCIPLKKAYNWEPVPAKLSPGEARHILGIQGQLWTEYIPTPDQVEYMAYPRLCALAEVAWSDAAGRKFTEFRGRLEQHLKRLDVIGVRYSRNGIAGKKKKGSV